MNPLFSVHASCYTNRIRSGLSFGYYLLENCKILRIVSNMDGLSGAASVIAVVSLALGSVRYPISHFAIAGLISTIRVFLAS